ncbi:UvrD-helicase domain-containing protein [Acinetobacter rathckeae]|uniref:UvrD-helicase domain-containing protein n=1 Tax=Acinetobacter rathckeae TaxID=2605272 RepID=UPI0018A32A93|nr:UvrD-helicase domain-containing protein [Acinetobacter rathckeae]MBF7687880.1 UvrD-helicase domain-containing protein [Acinetobacter rathckeae]MBF7687897.1 UvrD-helicase domain-containing protein [Acinetobacter rathckeae]
MDNSTAVSFDPIQDIQFTGLHWIEASAGSGKTFTLSSLIVRALVEKYLPKQVVATTFTRAAAAELKLRTRKRLLEAFDFFKQRQGYAEQENLTWLEMLKTQGTDPLYVVLLSQYFNKIDYLCSRLNVVISQLDDLFVGTLDSFSQKLLREFAFESGKIERADITDQSKHYIKQLIHDILREWLQQQSQQQIDFMYFAGHLHPAEHYMKLVEDTLNFSNAQFNSPMPPKLALEEIEQLQRKLSGLSVAHLAAYYTAEGEYIQGVSGTLYRDKSKFTALFEVAIPTAINAFLKDDGKAFFSQDHASLYKLQQQFHAQKLFTKKCPTDAAEAFYNDSELHRFFEVLTQLAEIQQQLQQTETYFKFYLCQQVKQRLPALLQYKGETTFAQQIKTLSDALQDSQGQAFAAFVQRSYPLIFVDEFQDTNQDQDNMLAKIWRDEQRYMQGCMVMVGDRKQAIYGFRGGDMLTFIQAQQDVTAKQGRYYRLKYNHRTVKPLVQAVDALLLQRPDFGEQVIYQAVEAGTRPHPSLVDAVGENHAPLRWLTISDKKHVSADIQVAWQISTLLQQAQHGLLYTQKDQQQQPIQLDDIAVLSKNHHNLDLVQYELERLGIRVNRPAKRSVFAGRMAQDVAAFLAAILNPFDERLVKRALATRLMGFNVSDLVQLETQADGLGQYIAVFDQIREMWFTRQFLTAWQFALNELNIWQSIVKYASRDNERAVVDLRHLSDLLSNESRHYQGPHNLYQWYIKQVAAPSEREWELERALSSVAGVQLMTIHQSKGLEFKIVFLINADSTFSEKNKTLNFSTTEVTDTNAKTQRVVEINDQAHLQEQALSQHQARAEAEQNRLWYVALTRASHRMYVVMTQPKNPAGVSFWTQGVPFEHVDSMQADEILSAPVAYREKTHEVIAIHAQPLPKLRLYPRSRTSFSALAQHLTRQQAQDLLVEQDSIQHPADDEIAVPSVTVMDAEPTPISSIAMKFPMGTQAGNFLHEIFEQIDFQNSQDWAIEIQRRFKNDYVALRQPLLEYYQTQSEQPEQQMIQAVIDWLQAIVQTPMHGEFCLQQLARKDYLSEFPFHLALSDRVFATQRIYRLLQEYGITIPTLNAAESARFMNGSIDLVYLFEGKYYIADYKSNFLGESITAYTTEQIAKNMSQSSYWLQACLYLVALHRYLKQKLQGYTIEQHLGGASYLYLRGMHGVAGYGVLYWQPDVELILRLDATLGYDDTIE